MTDFVGLIEFPFLMTAVFFAFRTASALKGGAYGRGMGFLAWGFLVMAVGHLHMQVISFFGVNLFTVLLGDGPGTIVWFLALVCTWGFTAYGFHLIYAHSRT